jgi:hypothetical protein
MRFAALALLGLLAAGCDDDTAGLGGDDMATIGADDLGTVCDPSACPAQSTVCKINVCAANACAVENAATGTSCTDSGGVACDGHGSCVAMHCMDQVRDGDETDVDCGGQSCGGCANGLACTIGADCATGFCSSNKCSARAAGASCSANTQCASGVCGVNGSGNCCTAACTSGSCGATACDGSGACVYPGASVACGTPSCSAAMLTPNACDGAGSCHAGSPAPCPNNLACASATACLPMCGSDPDCASGYYCASGCQPQQAVGAVCTLGDQCLSGHCVDGYCCNSVCTTACQACSASLTGGANGMCAAVTDGQADPRGLCGSSANVCQAGVCSGVPGVPGSVVATAGASSATVQWTVPSANGAAIDKYVITGAGAPINVLPSACVGSTVGSACSYTVTPLTDCVAYTFDVAAHNINGSSATASSAAVTPAQRPDTPSAPSESLPATFGASMTVTWTAPNAQGCAIDNYDVYISGPANGGDHVVGTTLSTTFSGLLTCAYPTGMCSSPYTFSVRAHNVGGWSDYSVGTAAVPKVSYTSDNLPGIWSAKGCTGCHTGAGPAPILDTAQAYTNASAEGSLIYLCPEGASASCPGHMVLLTVGNLDDTTLRTWVSDGNYQ